jgi:hypothetical protein
MLLHEEIRFVPKAPEADIYEADILIQDPTKDVFM